VAVDPELPILIVDDYRTMLKIVRGLLAQLGFRNVDEATDGSMAYEMISGKEKEYGLVIADWNMQPMTGLELLQKLRAAPDIAKTPFIMITAEAKAERVVMARRAGVDNYILKPFNQAVLRQKMSAVLGEL